jgi:hypothetical protein
MNGIKRHKHQFTIPYHHQQNGRIERANRTIRTVIKKSNKPVKIALKEIIKNYNNIRHIGINMSPEEAMKKENWGKVLANQKTYEKEFKITKKKCKKFEIGDQVLVKNDTKSGKMEDEFSMKAIVKKKCGENSYDVENDSKEMFRRHASNLERFGAGMLG